MSKLNKKILHIRYIIICCIIISCLPGMAQSSGPAMHEFRGLRFPQTPVELKRDSLDVLFAKFAKAGFNAVFPKVWYTGGTIYPSSVVEAAGGPGQLAAFHARDPMPDIIEFAHRHGLEVHAWVEYGFMMHHSYATGQHGALLTANPEWKNMTKDSLYYESTMYGNFFWADPGNPEVVDFIVDLHRELVERYPDIDGIHLDRIRYPNDEFGYTDIARQRFQHETGRPDPITIQRGTDNWRVWVDWRRRQTTDTAAKIYQAVKSVNENIIVSGAVVAPYMIDTNQEKLQYWPDWVANGLVDMISPLMYLSSTGDFVSQLHWIFNTLGDTDIPVYPRIAYPSYFGIDDTTQAQELLNGQVDHARSSGIEGLILWNHLTLTEADAFYYLENVLHQNDVVSPFSERITAASDQKWFERTGTWQEAGGGVRGTYLINEHDGEAVWTFMFPTAHTFDVFASWPASEDNTGAAVFTASVRGDKVFTRNVDQREHASWHYVGSASLDVFDPLTVRLSRSQEDGRLVADAVRVVKRSDARLEQVIVHSETMLELHFNIQLDPAGGVDMQSIRLSPHRALTSAEISDIGTLLLFTGEYLREFEAYTITIDNIVDVHGRDYTMVTGNFCVYPDGQNRWMHIVNDADSDAFWLQGDQRFWSNKIKLIDGYIGSGYRQTFNEGSPVGLQRAYWTMPVPADGNYQISANWTSDGNRARNVPYIIHGNTIVLDTVRVDQRFYGSRWNVLGSYSFAAGDSVTVELTNRIVPQPDETQYVIADAVKIQHVYVTYVEDDANPVHGIAQEYTLEQNYPNPFNPSTTIEFTLPVAGHATIIVYDILGRWVATIAYGWYSAGSHRVHFDASGLSSGLYLYSLQSKNSIRNRKMILVR
jgi:uncharacterized lipoprotein YddW (UPF0748 family)